MQPAAVIAILAAAILIGAVVSYNRFVEQRQLVRDSWSNVETELQRRHDLVPNLVSTVKGYAAHEEQLFTMVTEARSRALAPHSGPADLAKDENALASGMRTLFAVSEAYPDLKASANFLALQQELIVTEDRIQASRRLYNGNVRELNRRVESFPSSVVAGACNFTREDYFEIEPAVREAGVPGTSF